MLREMGNEEQPAQLELSHTSLKMKNSVHSILQQSRSKIESGVFD